MVSAQKDAATPPEDNGIGVKLMTAQADMALADQKFQHEKEMDYAELRHKMQLERESAQQDAQLKAEQAATERQIRVQQAANPQPNQPTKQGA